MNVAHAPAGMSTAISSARDGSCASASSSASAPVVRPRVMEVVDGGAHEVDPRARAPGGAQRATAALGLEVEDLDAVEVAGQAVRGDERAVGARVVGDENLPGERELGLEVGVQAADRAREHRLPVEHRHDDLDLRRAGGKPVLAEDRGRAAENERRPACEPAAARCMESGRGWVLVPWPSSPARGRRARVPAARRSRDDGHTSGRRCRPRGVRAPGTRRRAARQRPARRDRRGSEGRRQQSPVAPVRSRLPVGHRPLVHEDMVGRAPERGLWAR